MKNKDFILIVVALLFSGLISWSFSFRQYVQRDTVNVHLFPKQINGWIATEIPISDHDYGILETRNAFSRLYRSAKGEELLLFVVYSQNNRKVSHPPEICYTGSGATILSKGKVILNAGDEFGTFKVNRFSAEQGNDKQWAYYWFKVGNSFTASYWKQQILIAFKTLIGQPASSAMIRLSVSSLEGETEKTDKIAQEFTRLIVPFLNQYLP
jgi:EpsI family protein